MNSTLFNRVSVRSLTIITLLSLILSAFPAPFFVAEAADTIFEDSFESTSAFSSPAWVDDPQWSTNSSDSRTGTKQAQVVGHPTSTSTLETAIDTSGYEDLDFSFWYKKLGMDSGDGITVEWYDGSVWSLITTISGVNNDDDDDSEWQDFSITLPTGAENNPDFAIRFVSDMNTAGNDKFFLEDVSLEGDLTEKETETSETIVVSGDTAPGYDLPGWLFNRDTDTATPFEFNDDQASLGDGALYVLPIGSNPSDKFIGELFVHKLVEDIVNISYEYRLGDSVDSGKANEFYANAYVNFDGSDDYGHCVYNIIPTDGSAGWHTMIFDPTQDYDVRTRGSAPSACPDSPSELPDTAELRMFAINLGDTNDSDEGVDGYFDKVVTVIEDGSNTHTTTYDFEPKELTSVDETVVVDPTDMKGWEFNGDRSGGGWTEGTGSFVEGPDTAPIGDGSAQITTDEDSDRYKLRKLVDSGLEIADFTELTYSTYRDSSSDGDVTVLALQFDVQFDNSDFVAPDTSVVGRIVYEPYHDNTVVDDSWQTWDTMDDDAGWWIAGPSYPYPSACEQSNPCTWDELVTAYPDMAVSSSSLENIDPQGAVMFKAGGSWGNFIGNVDEFIFGFVEDETIYTTTYDFEPEPTSTVTLCKYDTDEEPLEGWTLLLRGEHVEDVSVPADNVGGVDTISLLSSGISYIVEVIGTWLNDRDPDNYVDAEYSTEDDWDTYMDGFTGYGEDILDLQINQSFVDWGTYSEDHSYATSFMPVSDGVANFRIFDGTGETPNASWYNDNSGSLDVTLSGGYAGITDEEGCVTFYDVPYGTYEVDEIDQEGWYYYSGKGEVTVDEDEEQFVVVNSDTEPVDVSLIITNPVTDDEVLSGEHTFEAEYTDDDDTVDTIHWAIKVGSCEGNNPDINMAGFGMDGYSPATYDHNTGHIEVTVDMSAWEDDDYCFVVNPQETGGQTDTDREIRWFTLENPVMIACEADVNLLANGSFETPVVTHDKKWDAFVDGTSGLGWMVDWFADFTGSPQDALLELHAGVLGWLPSDGSQHAELDSDWDGPGGINNKPASVVISQLIPTVADKTYTLSWDFSPRPGLGTSQNQLGVSVDSVELDDLPYMADGTDNNNTEWTSYSYEFTGTGDDVEIAFWDDGSSNGQGTLLDNTSLTCNPNTGYSDVYCGDGEVNQDWEQCEPGEAGCASYCRFENQCHADLQLMKITLDETNSASFDGKSYIGAADKIAPNGYWFNVADFGSDSAVDVVGDVNGLALGYDGSELKLAFEGSNGSGEIDYVQGSLEFMGFTDIESDDVTREINGTSYKLEPTNGSGGFPDVFNVTSSSTVEFDLRADTGNDGVTLALVPTDEFGQCENSSGSGNEEDTTFYRIEGYLWNDEDQDDVVDEGESYLNGWTLSITNGTTTATTSSNSEGYFFFDVEAGTWTLTADTQANWTLVYPSSGSHEITVPETVVTQSSLGFFDSLLAMFTNVAHADTVITLAGQYNFGFASTGGGGGSSSGSSGGSSTGGSGSDDDDGPTEQVAGAQTSIFPNGAPNAGFGAQTDSADRGLLMVFILAAAIYFGRRLNSHAK